MQHGVIDQPRRLLDSKEVANKDWEQASGRSLRNDHKLMIDPLDEYNSKSEVHPCNNNQLKIYRMYRI